MFFQLTQGSALARATLGWKLVNAFGVRIRVAYRGSGVVRYINAV